MLRNSLVAFLISLAFTACAPREEPDPEPRVGEAEEAIEEMGEAAEGLGEEMEEGMDEMGEAMEEPPVDSDEIPPVEY